MKKKFQEEKVKKEFIIESNKWVAIEKERKRKSIKIVILCEQWDYLSICWMRIDKKWDKSKSCWKNEIL